jgi:hypothetical protein
MDRFRAINPVIKAPELHLRRRHGPHGLDRSSSTTLEQLRGRGQRAHAARAGSRARWRCANRARDGRQREGRARSVYEKEQRRRRSVTEPWVEPHHREFHAAFGELEKAVADAASVAAGRADATPPDVAVAVAWRFGQSLQLEGGARRALSRPLVEYSRRAEALPEFASTPLD